MNTTSITLLGTADAVPEPGRDVASFTINRRHLVDTGWRATARMVDLGLDPLQFQTIIITHCHQDHFLGLPQFFFYWSQCWRPEMGVPELTVVGPPDIVPIMDATWKFLMAERYPQFTWRPEIQVMEDGDVRTTSDYTLAACRTRHPVEGLCHTYTDNGTGTRIAFTGDTAYHEPIADHVRGSHLLLHDATFPHDCSRERLDRDGHSTAVDAAKLARLADVDQLLLMHYQLERHEESLAKAAEIFPEVAYAQEGQTIDVSR